MSQLRAMCSLNTSLHGTSPSFGQARVPGPGVAASTMWDLPYLPLDPAELRQTYEAVFRVNAQPDKAGLANMVSTQLHIDFPRAVQQEVDDLHGVLPHQAKVRTRTTVALAVVAIEDDTCCQVHANNMCSLLMLATLPFNAGDMLVVFKN